MRLFFMSAFIFHSILLLGEFFISTISVMSSSSPMLSESLSMRWSCGEPINSLSLNEFRSLFALNKNLKLDSGWLYFKVRPKKNLIKGYPSNVKEWKKKLFFISRDDYEFPSGTSGDARVPMVLRSWGIPGQFFSTESFLSLTSIASLL